jgi:DNA-binding LacI/PurR family transcriptional regulator
VIRAFQGDPRAFEDFKDVIGSSLLLWPHFPPVEQSDALVRSLLDLKRPVFLFDGRKSAAFSDLPDNPNLLCAQDLAYQAGYDMANLLIAQGHKRVGFFTHGPEPFWSVKRRSTMEKAFASAGFPNAVVLLRAGPDRHKDGISIDASENNPTVTPRMKEQARYLKAQIDHIEQAFDSSPFKQRMLGEMQEMLVQLSGVWTRFIPLCEQALAMQDITAWVAAEDQIAVYSLLPFLVSRKISVPRKVSIVGFNNIPEAIGAGLTAFDFNVAGLVSAAIDLFLFPERRRHYIDPSTQEVVVKGYIIERGSIGPPKTRNLSKIDTIP